MDAGNAIEVALKESGKALLTHDDVKRMCEPFEAKITELMVAVGTLQASELYLDDNRPWRLMLTRGKFHYAVAEQHPESTVGDGAWKDGQAICDIVNAAIKLLGSR